jgi:predicted TIM-barrel fold metal-dependent hydrolase
VITDIVDLHVHFWQPETNPWYPGLASAMAPIAHTYLAEDYRADAAGYNVTEIVHVSATTAPRAFLEEARWLETTAESTGWPPVTVGTVDPDRPWAVIESDLAELRKSPLLRGIRVLYGFDPSSDTAGRLVRALAAEGLVFDAVVHPYEAAAYRRLLDGVPDLVVAVEHAGWPHTADPDHFRESQRGMAQLAARPLTYCEISGLAMTLHSVALDAQRPWIETCLTAFGPQRCMFASNFPVDSLFGGFAELYSTYQAIAAELPADAQQALFAGTARHVYRL